MIEPSSTRVTRSGARFGAYRIEREIGRGGAAVVHEAIHERLGRRVALKVLHGYFTAHPTLVARFEQEARLVARLHHPHVVAALDVGVQDGEPYLVMELVEGETLAGRLQRTGRLALEEIVSIFLPVCSALAAAHEMGIVHRDMKPANVMLARGAGGHVSPKVLDFGISKEQDGPESAPVTRNGSVLGTVSYLSPEQARGSSDVGPRSDVYALGVMLFQCATGALPFKGASTYDVMHAILTQAAPALSTLAADLPAELDAVVARALEREPSARFPTTRALGRALLPFADAHTRGVWERELLGSPSVGAIPAPRPLEESTLTDEHAAAFVPPRARRGRRGVVRSVGVWCAGIALASLAALALRSYATHPAVAVVRDEKRTPAAPSLSASDVHASLPPTIVTPVSAPPPAAVVPVASSAASPRATPRPLRARPAPSPPARGANGAPILE